MWVWLGRAASLAGVVPATFRVLLIDQLVLATERLIALRGQPEAFNEWAGIHAALVAEIRRLQRPWWRRLVIRLARALGWGSAGECPGSSCPTTPAVRERVCRVAAAAEQGGVDLTRASAQRPEPVGVAHDA